MNLLEGFTDQAKQQTTIVLADGSRAVLLLEYRPNQIGWFASLTYGRFTLNGQRLVSSPNYLRQWREQIPFGLAVLGVNNVDPLRQTDLADGSVSLYLLDQADVEAVEAAVYPGT